VNELKEIRVCELFAGVGGFRKGFEQATDKIQNRQIPTRRDSRHKRNNVHACTRNTRNGKPLNQNICSFKTVFANEIDKHASAVYRARFGEKGFHEGDIREIRASDIPDHDILCGGFPCQPFSIAGKRKGFEDTRGTLFFEIARVLKKKKPKFLLLENVKGLLSSEEGEVFKRIINVLNSLGYIVDYRIFDSQYFGVPQHRERVFIFGVEFRWVLKDTINGGQFKRTNLLEKIISNYLREILLNKWEELKKQSEDKLSDLELNSLLLEEVENLGLFKKYNISKEQAHRNLVNNYQTNLIGVKTQSKEKDVCSELEGEKNNHIYAKTVTSESQTEKVTESLSTELLWKKLLGGNLKNKREYTTLTLIKRIMKLETCSSAILKEAMLLCILQEKEYWQNWLERAKSNLTAIKESIVYEKEGYERIMSNNRFFVGNREARERVFIVGYLGGFSGRKIFPLRKSNEVPGTKRSKQIVCPTITSRYYKRGKTDPYIAEGGLMQVGTIGEDSEATRVYNPNGIARTIKDGGGMGAKTGLYCVGNYKKTITKRVFETPVEINKFLRKHKGEHTIKEIADYLELPKTQIEHYFRTDKSRAIPCERDWFLLKSILEFDNSFDSTVCKTIQKLNEFESTQRIYDGKGLAKTLQAGSETGLYAIPCLTPGRPKRQQGRRFKENGEPMFTLTGQDIHGIVTQQRIRRLTPTECERLQGFPDGWTASGLYNGELKEVSDTQRYKMMGNAVTVNVIQAIAQKIKEVIK